MTTGWYRGTGRTWPDHQQEAGPARWATLVARHALPRPGGPSPVAGRARPGAGALTRRIRALPDGAMSALTWDQGSEMARHQRQGRRHREPGVLFAHPHSPWEGAANENTNRHRGPLPAQRHPHHQPPTPARAPSPTNRATAPAPPSTTPPHKRHSPNSLSPSLDTTVLPLGWVRVCSVRIRASDLAVFIVDYVFCMPTFRGLEADGLRFIFSRKLLWDV